ncbi:hypothetical protein [Pseudoxanthomonas winnipegensis]|uniref:hypothetical protein n=1 Tax=Pseudoxanthomonas winnipegensis TaxID=2480810 RepID=UPI003F835EF9
MRFAVRLLAGAVLIAPGGLALARTSPTLLPRYAAGAKRVRAPIKRAQLDEMGALVHASQAHPPGVRAAHEHAGAR